MKSHILLVDDERLILDLFQTFFTKEGYEVTIAGTGKEAMDAVRQHTIDVVFLDIFLGEISGLDVLEEIRRERPKLPVIMLTGVGYDQELIEEASRKGATWYLSKDLPLELLVKEVERALKTSKANADSPGS